MKLEDKKEELDILYNKYRFLTAIEWSQRMLANIQETPNRYGFYLSPGGVILRRSSQNEHEATYDATRDREK